MTFRLGANPGGWPLLCRMMTRRRLDQVFGMLAELYNAMLESWKGAHRWWKEHRRSGIDTFPYDRNLSRQDRMKELTLLRKELPEWERVSVNAARGGYLPLRLHHPVLLPPLPKRGTPPVGSARGRLRHRRPSTHRLVPPPPMPHQAGIPTHESSGPVNATSDVGLDLKVL